MKNIALEQVNNVNGGFGPAAAAGAFAAGAAVALIKGAVKGCGADGGSNLSDIAAA